MNILLKGITFLSAFLFLVFAYWQFNDPDAFRWVVVYGLTSILGFASLFYRLPWYIIAILSSVAFVFSFYYVWIVISQGLHYFEDEAGREMMGSLMVAVYLGYLTIASRITRV
ncbi:MAG: hypothetical protein OXF06_14150 [Bacteroidetes bacterium]|nr:hypothetical protein [Bacteroidota bacterium]MCY4225957.1 hypothetical protein [Bacteroidota bacterium]